MRNLARKNIFSVCFISVVLLAVLGCPQHKSVADIQRDPAYYANRDVTVVGTVTSSYGALGTGMYEIDDGTGKIWVFAERTGVPSDGSHVASIGRIQPTFTFGGKSFVTVLKERQRKRG